MPYTTTLTTPLANGVTAENLVKILQHHRTILDLLTPRRTRHASTASAEPSHTTTTTGNNNNEGENSNNNALEKSPSTTTTTTTTTATTTYTITEPTTFGYRSYALHLTGQPDGVETAMTPEGRAQIRVRWRIEDECLVQAVEIRGGWCWSRRRAKGRVLADTARQHQTLMQLAATSKSITGSYQ